jgi:hypothetical protein
VLSLKQQQSCTVKQPTMPRDRHTLLAVDVEVRGTNEEAYGGSINASGLSAVAEDLRVLLQLHACQQVLAVTSTLNCYIEVQQFDHIPKLIWSSEQCWWPATAAAAAARQQQLLSVMLCAAL